MLAYLALAASFASPTLHSEDPPAAPAPALPQFEKPILVVAGGKPIVASGGHAAPFLVDLDGDKKRDLVVGMYGNDGSSASGGVGRFYKNLGTNAKPRYDTFTLFETEGAPVALPSNCCIGFDPCFVDLDGDGKLDLVNGIYHPAAIYWFKGLGGTKLGPRQELLKEEESREFSMSTTNCADLDGDKLVDLVIGDTMGGVFWSRNTGTAKKPKFGPRVALQAGDHAVRVAHKSDPHAVDFDGDGKLDLLVGGEIADVAFFRGKGTTDFEPGISLFMGEPVEPVASYPTTLEKFEPHRVIPGYRLRVTTADWNGDGKLDLVLGNCFEEETKKPAKDEEAASTTLGNVYVLLRK
jgi:FG-GAP-like repeat